MSTRVVVIELPDVEADDRLHMALIAWNANNPDDQVRYRIHTSLIVGAKGTF